MHKKKLGLIITSLFISASIFAGCSMANIYSSKKVSSTKEINPPPAEKVVEEKPKDPFENVKFVPYKDRVEHIFFHSAIVYPKLAFDGDYKTNDYDDWYVTVGEFKKILEALHSKNFILVDINSLYEEYMKDGKPLLKRVELMIPEGKRPIIISIDDVSYYKYMKGDGFLTKLILDDKGEVTGLLTDPEGKEITTKEGDVVTILDEFVKSHPDFSLKGAKGTIALTGYDGILGYRSDSNDANFEAERAAATPVVAKLKATGWNFASHSYTHNPVPKMTQEKLVYDTEKWQKEVGSLVGPTQVYIYPFGSGLQPSDPKFQYLQSKGYKIFCHVGKESYEKIVKDTNAVVTDRRAIDGMGLRHKRKSTMDLYDAKDIIDLTVRPNRPVDY